MGGTISFGGLVSGLNTNAIITAMLAPDQQQITNLQTQQATIQNQEGGLNDINTKLTALSNATLQMMLQNTFLTKAATVNNPTGLSPVLSVTASSAAANGSFQVTVNQLATATSVASQSAIGQPINAAVPLASAGFAQTPTTGTFSINGQTITIDSSTVLSDGVNAAGSDTIIAKINGSGAGVTASLTNDSSGRLNAIQLSSTGSIQLGSGADTSNFLSASNLIAAQPVTSGGTTTVTSTGGLGVANASAILNSAQLATPLSASSGSFMINGVAISYDSTVDTLSAVLSRINTSAAGVTASYDPVADKVNLKNSTTGSTAISLQDVTGNFLAATGVLGATQSFGKDALFSIDSVNGGAQQSSTSNTVTDLVPGVTLNLQSAAPGQPVGVSIANDPTNAVTAIQNFVTAFNGVADLVNTDTAYNSQTQTSGMFFSDSMIYSIPGDMFTQLFSPSGLTGAVQSLSDIGLTTGAIGSTPGSTNDLQFDPNKFTAAMQSDPNDVLNLLQGTNGTGGVMNTLNNYLNGLTSASGLFYQDQQSMDSQLRSLSTQITSAQQNMSDKQTALTNQFANMEATLAGLQSQGAALTSQLNAINGTAATTAAASTATSTPAAASSTGSTSTTGA